MGGLYKELPEGLDEVDVVIVGGSWIQRNRRLRRGISTERCLPIPVHSDCRGWPRQPGPSKCHLPMLMLNNILPGNTDTLFYEGIPEKAMGHRSLVVPSGGVLGGGSSINLLTYSRAQAIDYDQWGVEGWSSKDLVPYLQRLETYKGKGTPETHGYFGPMVVTPSNYTAKASEEGFIKAAAKLGYPEARDIQDLETVNATQRNIRYVSGGKRQDAASNYLHPRLGDSLHPNLYVLTQHQVIRVLFDGNKASGVELRPNPKFNDGTEKPVQRVKAKKLVILSSGALGTPLVLERSGVGNSEILGKAGVNVVAEVPGVGAEYQDHQLMTYAYYSSLLPNETFDAIYSGRTNVDELIKKNDPIMGWTAADVYSKLRPSDEEAKALGPAFESAWNRDYKTNPTKPLAMITSLNGFPGDPTGQPEVQYFSCSTFTPYPYSRGHLHITSKDLDAPLDFATGFFADENDVDIKKSVWSYKKQREIIRRMDVYRGEFAPLHPAFAADSDAATTSEPLDGPLPDDVSDIVYTAEDDAVLEQWLRANVGTTWHSLGTCKMAPKSEGGVVDSSLSVYGVEKLKIADLSVPPGNVGANTANTAYMIGEKAADIFIQELKGYDYGDGNNGGP
ncbi:glucose-methanol-choline (gmc) oxidoreductase [Aspergillus nomiae NRRL 13137]|uniref:Glucose-methanol-choline (Gmc) oxidoreductase n=1 Tax=Aspergillus nomiae NRRL (strain ATCC 15546 / NRRL 13137 / CBS 260.88 / M93) TaxID=1509407 RepID=A0A0L1ILW9_ASPN3|nr:glucose-methanol-choline (gmc) oxidoreductase [Aspergillus nomiae NRRL 13137]KNG80497.1 glucose-methanol-choline (gmc) oxidoreductase [Aspergillus nomiae NRRL 13137]